MRYRLYLDTSVLGAVCDPGPVNRVEASVNLLIRAARKEIVVCISPLVVEELNNAPETVRLKVREFLDPASPEILAETDETRELADYYLREGVFSAAYSFDARHVAVATVYEVDALVSWNYRHMVNLHKRKQITGANLMHGFKMIEIITPEELAEDE